MEADGKAVIRFILCRVWIGFPDRLIGVFRHLLQCPGRCPDIKYETNYRLLQQELKALDERTAARIAASDVEYFIIYHPALTYYARDYGLRQIAIEADGKEPSAKQLTQLIRQAREDGVRAHLYQSQFPASAVEVIARDIDAEYAEVDPLREDVIANIEEITGIITRR